MRARRRAGSRDQVDGMVFAAPGPVAKTLSASHPHGERVGWFLYVHEPRTYTGGTRAVHAPIWFDGFRRGEVAADGDAPGAAVHRLRRGLPARPDRAARRARAGPRAGTRDRRPRPGPRTPGRRRRRSRS